MDEEMENIEGDGVKKRTMHSEKTCAYESNICERWVGKRRSCENLKGNLTPFVQDSF